MGYTHTLVREKSLDPVRFVGFVGDCKKIIDNSDVKIIDGEFDEDYHTVIYGGEPLLSMDMVRFVSPDAYDLFEVEREFKVTWENPDYKVFDQFCKTARHSYDKVVVACLIAFKRWFPEAIIKSDGEPHDLTEGINLYYSSIDSNYFVKLEEFGGQTVVDLHFCKMRVN